MKKNLILIVSVFVVLASLVGISVYAYNKPISQVKFFQFVPRADGKTIEQIFAELPKESNMDILNSDLIAEDLPEPEPTDEVYYNEQPTEANYQRKIDFIKKSNNQLAIKEINSQTNAIRLCIDESKSNDYNLKLVKMLRNGEIQCYVDNLK
jgi:hypothetical protein